MKDYKTTVDDVRRNFERAIDDIRDRLSRVAAEAEELIKDIAAQHPPPFADFQRLTLESELMVVERVELRHPVPSTSIQLMSWGMPLLGGNGGGRLGNRDLPPGTYDAIVILKRIKEPH